MEKSITLMSVMQSFNVMFVRRFKTNEALLGHMRFHTVHFKEGKLKNNSTIKEGDLTTVDEDINTKSYKADAVMTAYVEQTFLDKGYENIYKEVWIIRNETEEDFVRRYMKNNLEDKAIYAYRRRVKCELQFLCERATPPKGKGNDLTEGWSTDCGAYVSFTTLQVDNKQICVIRKYFVHSGHTITDSKMDPTSDIDPALKVYVSCLVQQDKSAMDVIVLAHGWVKGRGLDTEDCKYNVNNNHVNKIRVALKNGNRKLAKNGISVDTLWYDVLEENIVLYQALTDTQPMIIVYQNTEQRRNMELYASDLVYMDASFKGLPEHGYAVHCLLVKNQYNNSTPIAFFATSSITHQILVSCLSALKEHAAERGIAFEPKAFMLDKDVKQYSSIQMVFPSSRVLLCWIQMLQVIYRWLNQSESGVSTNLQSEERKKIVNLLRDIKETKSEEEFQKMCDSLPANLKNYTRVFHYIQEQWIPISSMWANIGRSFFTPEEISIYERVFLFLKYNWLGGYGNKRLDELLLLIDGQMYNYHNYAEELERLERLGKKAGEGDYSLRQSAKMMSQGWEQKSGWVDDFACICQIPSQSHPESIAYTVNLTRSTCTCDTDFQKVICKHIHVAKNLASTWAKPVDMAKQDLALDIINKGHYFIEDNDVIVFDGEHSNTIVDGDKCTCIAALHNQSCICKIVSEWVCPKTQDADEEHLYVTMESNTQHQEPSQPQMASTVSINPQVVTAAVSDPNTAAVAVHSIQPQQALAAQSMQVVTSQQQPQATITEQHIVTPIVHQLTSVDQINITQLPIAGAPGVIQTIPATHNSIQSLTPSTYTMHTMPASHNSVVSIQNIQNPSQVVHVPTIVSSGPVTTTVHALAAPISQPVEASSQPAPNTTTVYSISPGDSANMAVQELQDMIAMIQQGNYRPGLLNGIHTLHGTGRV